MQRTLKQLLYGLFYLAILALVVWLVAAPRLEVVPSCTDGIQNQSEEGIDCGGECEACGLSDLKLDIGGVEIVEVGDRVTLLVEVENPSVDFGVESVEYEFDILGSLGQSLASRSGTITLLPTDRKYAVEAGINVPKEDINEVLFTLGEAEFVEESSLPRYDVQISNVETTFPEELVSATGVLTNDNSFNLREVGLAVVFYTPERQIANAGATLISDLKAFETREFLISVPRNLLFVDESMTEIIVTKITR